MRGEWRSNPAGCDFSSATIYVSFQPRSTQSIPSTTEEIWKRNVRRSHYKKRREFNGKGLEIYLEDGEQNWFMQLLFQPAKSPWLRENPSSHFVRPQQWKDPETLLLLSGYTWTSPSHRGQPNKQGQVLWKGEWFLAKNNQWRPGTAGAFPAIIREDILREMVKVSGCQGTDPEAVQTGRQVWGCKQKVSFY